MTSWTSRLRGLFSRGSGYDDAREQGDVQQQNFLRVQLREAEMRQEQAALVGRRVVALQARVRPHEAR